MTGARLLHLGTVVADVVLGVPALPPRGGDVLASAATVTAGGGFNVLAAAARQGMPAVYGGAHGTGPLADLTRAALAAEGIAVLLPPAPGLDTGFVITLVEPGGERTFVTSPGAEARLAPDALAAVTARPQDTVYLSGYALAHEANRAALLGWLPGLPAAARLVFDPGPLGAQVPAAALDQVARRADWWAGNAAEAAARTGEATPEAAALRWRGVPAGPACWSALARTAACWPARCGWRRRGPRAGVPGGGGGHHRRGRHPHRRVHRGAGGRRGPGRRGPAGQRGRGDLGNQAGTGDRTHLVRAGPLPGPGAGPGTCSVPAGPGSASPAGGRVPGAAGRSPGRGAAGARTMAPGPHAPPRQSRKPPSRS